MSQTKAINVIPSRKELFVALSAVLLESGDGVQRVLLPDLLEEIADYTATPLTWDLVSEFFRLPADLKGCSADPKGCSAYAGPDQKDVKDNGKSSIETNTIVRKLTKSNDSTWCTAASAITLGQFAEQFRRRSAVLTWDMHFQTPPVGPLPLEIDLVHTTVQFGVAKPSQSTPPDVNTIDVSSWGWAIVRNTRKGDTVSRAYHGWTVWAHASPIQRDCSAADTARLLADNPIGCVGEFKFAADLSKNTLRVDGTWVQQPMDESRMFSFSAVVDCPADVQLRDCVLYTSCKWPEAHICAPLVHF